MTACPHVRSDLGGYVLNALEPQEAEAVREHLARCSSCAAEHARLAGLPAMLALAEGLEDAPAPPPAVEERVLDAVALEQSRTRPSAGPRRRRLRMRPRVLVFAGLAAAALVAVVLALALQGGNAPPSRGFEVALRPVAGSGASGVAWLKSVSSGTTLHMSAGDLAGDPSIVYEVYCDGQGWTASAGTFRANAAGHAYAVLQTAVRRGEYDSIRVVRKQHGADGRIHRSVVLEAHLPRS